MWWFLRHLSAHYHTHPDCLCCRYTKVRYPRFSALMTHISSDGVWWFYIYLPAVAVEAHALFERLHRLGWIR
jgi:hypothetical protein